MEVCREEELAEGESLAVRVPVPEEEAGPGEEEGRRIAVFRWRGRVHALDDRCPHAGGPLAEGTLVDGTVVCSWHCAAFDLETGRSLDSISRWDADVYPAEVREGRILVRLPGSEGRDEAGRDDEPPAESGNA